MSESGTYETALLLRIGKGDEKAFEALFMKHKDRVYEIAVAYTESEVYAEEIVQDVFMMVWKKREELQGITDFTAWLFMITRNKSFNVLRDKSRLAKREKSLIDYLPASYEEGEKLIAEDTRKLIYQAMELLSPRERKAFELMKLRELSREEAAKEMGISPNTIKVHLMNAIRIVRAYLVSKGVFLLCLFVQG